MAETEDRSATLLVRVWLEAGGQGFRARLTAGETTPGAGEDVTVAVAASPAEVLDAVRAWLAEFTGGASASVAGNG